MALEASRPVFIGGLIKSGTSLLRAMLGQHSCLASGLETYWFDMQWPNAVAMHQPGLPGRYEKNLDRQIERLGQFYKLPASKINEFKSLSTDAETFLSLLMNEYARSINKPRWIEKTPGNILHIPRIMSNWPDAQLLVCMRNPLDVFASCREAELWDDPEKFTALWVSYYSAFQRAIDENKMDEKNYYLVSYEKLILSTEETMKQLLGFLDESYETSVANYKGQSEEFTMVKSVTGKSSTTLKRMQQPINNSRIDIYKNSVSAEEIELMKKVAINAGLEKLWCEFAR